MVKSKSSKTEKTSQLSGNELLELLNKQWANVNDIQKIGGCGKNKAQKVKKEIKEKIQDLYDKNLPYGVVPMEEVIEYYHINIKFLKKISNENKKRI